MSQLYQKNTFDCLPIFLVIQEWNFRTILCFFQLLSWIKTSPREARIFQRKVHIIRTINLKICYSTRKTPVTLNQVFVDFNSGKKVSHLNVCQLNLLSVWSFWVSQPSSNLTFPLCVSDTLFFWMLSYQIFVFNLFFLKGKDTKILRTCVL